MIQSIRLLFLAVFILGAFQATAQTESKVYITKTGAKYHKSSCRFAETGWAASLSEAKDRGLTACLVSKPGGGSTSTPATSTPATSSSTETNSLRSTTPSSSKPAATTSSSQCRATTKAGSRCSRKASSGSSYCWEHAG